MSLFFFFFNDTATTEIYTLSLHDALPIYQPKFVFAGDRRGVHLDEFAVRVVDALLKERGLCRARAHKDRKSTRLNSSHDQISYAVFCLKKKKYRCIHAKSDCSRTTSTMSI